MSLETKVNALETQVQDLENRLAIMERRCKKANKARVEGLMAALQSELGYVVFDNGGDGSLGVEPARLSAKLKKAADDGLL